MSALFLRKAGRSQQRELENPLGWFLLCRSEPGFVSGMLLEGKKNNIQNIKQKYKPQREQISTWNERHKDIKRVS